MPKKDNELNETNEPNLSFDDVEKERKLKEEREKYYQTKDTVVPMPVLYRRILRNYMKNIKRRSKRRACKGRG